MKVWVVEEQDENYHSWRLDSIYTSEKSAQAYVSERRYGLKWPPEFLITEYDVEES